MHRAAILLIVTTVLLLTGCAGPGRTSGTAGLSIPCSVVDHTTRKPIQHARIMIVDHPIDGDLPVFHGPFITDAQGRTTVVVPSTAATATPKSFRLARVEAPGFEPRNFPLERTAVGAPTAGMTFDLFPLTSPRQRLRAPRNTVTMAVP